MVKIAENEEIIVVPMEESMINEVSKIASHTKFFCKWRYFAKWYKSMCNKR